MQQQCPIQLHSLEVADPQFLDSQALLIQPAAVSLLTNGTLQVGSPKIRLVFIVDEVT
jgi:hypothetical protein